MSSNIRDNIKKRLDTADRAAEQIEQIFAALGELYREQHPEITTQYEVAFGMLEEVRGLIDGFKKTY